MPKPLLIFDFDGVLVDSFDTAFGLIKEMLPGQDFTEADYLECFEGNVYESTRSAKYCFVVPGFFDEYLKRLIKLPPFEGIADVIRRLSESHVLTIVSSTKSSVIREWLEQYQLAGCFSDIFGEDVSRSKVEKLNMLLERYQLPTSRCLFITDTLGDLREAEKVGMPSIAVTYGWHDEERLKRGLSIGLAHTPDELAWVIEKSLNESDEHDKTI